MNRSDIIETFGKFEGEMGEKKDGNVDTIYIECLCPFKENVSRGDKMPVYEIVKVSTIAEFVFRDGKPDYFAVDEKGYSCLGSLIQYAKLRYSEIESELIGFGFVKKKQVQMSLFSLF